MAFVINGERIKQLRLKQQLSQEDLALSSNISVSVISRIENNRYLITKLNTVERLAMCLNTTESDILKKIPNMSYKEYARHVRNKKRPT